MTTYAEEMTMISDQNIQAKAKEEMERIYPLIQKKIKERAEGLKKNYNFNLEEFSKDNHDYRSKLEDLLIKKLQADGFESGYNPDIDATYEFYAIWK